MNSIQFLAILLLILCSGCQDSTNEEKQIEDLKTLNQSFKEVISQDDIGYDSLNISVNRDNSTNLQKGLITWSPQINPYEPFLKEYMTEILSNLHPKVIAKFDSIIFETYLPDADYIFKRYRGSKAEIKQLQTEQNQRPEKYRTLIHHIVRNRLVYAVGYFDQFLARNRELFFRAEGFKWMDKGFLVYCESFYRKMENGEDKENELWILRDLFGEGTVWHRLRGPYDLINYMLEDVEEEPLSFSLNDTLKYGIKPDWFKEVGIR